MGYGTAVISKNGQMKFGLKPNIRCANSLTLHLLFVQPQIILETETAQSMQPPWI